MWHRTERNYLIMLHNVSTLNLFSTLLVSLLEIEKKYLPHRDYDGNAFLESGRFWHRQSHIFTVPFYYIDYTLAQICAFQFWKKDRDNHQQAWADYVNLCNAAECARAPATLHSLPRDRPRCACTSFYSWRSGSLFLGQ